MSGAARIHAIGPHRVELQEPELCCMRWDGEVTAEHLGAAQALIDELGGGAGPVFVLHDFSGMTNLTPAARRLAVTAPVTTRFAGIICWGASFHIRIIAQMVERVVRLLRPDAPVAYFFATEKEARAFLEKERPRMEAAYARRSGGG